MCLQLDKAQLRHLLLRASQMHSKLKTGVIVAETHRRNAEKKFMYEQASTKSKQKLPAQGTVTGNPMQFVRANEFPMFTAISTSNKNSTHASVTQRKRV